MKKKLTILTAGILSAIMLTACGQDPAITKFQYEVDDFCTRISEIDASINNIDAQSDNAISQLLLYLDELDEEFEDFAELDFPTDYDYLESLADEAGEYMTEAVESYKETYSNGYNEAYAEYAQENYSRAYKRIQFIIARLQGKDPENANANTNEE